MFGTIRRHQKWLWLVIITLTVISFVVYFSPYQRVSGGLGGRPVNLGSIDGRPVTVEAYREAQADVYLRYFLAHGDWPDRDPAARQMGFDEQREIYFRLLILQKIRELSIQASNESVARVAADVLRSYRRGGGVTLDEFEKGVLHARRMTAEDFERFLRHELCMQQLIHVAGLCGTLITPAGAKALYRHEHEELTAAMVVFPATNYEARVTVTPGALEQFFTNQMARYRVPERAQVSYVKFDLTNFFTEVDEGMAKLTNFAALVQFGIISEATPETAQLTNLAAVIDVIYGQRGTNYYREARSPEEAKQLIKDEIRRNAALTVARRTAAEFARVIFDMTPVRAANLEKVAAESNLTVRITVPFDRDNGPSGLHVGPAFIKAAFGLTDDDPFGGPIVGEDGVYVVAFDKRLPSEIPSLDAIRAEVAADFRFTQATNLAYQAGADFYHVLTNGMAQGKSFSSICLDTRLKSMLLPPFSRSTRSLPVAEEYVSLGLLQQVAFKVPVGQVSDFVPTSDGGFIVNVRSRLPVDEKKMEAELPAFLAVLRQAGQREAFDTWFRTQADQDPGFRGILDYLAKRERPATAATP